MSTQTHSLLQSRENIDFLVFDWLKAGNLLSRERYTDHTENDLRIMLDVAARIAETKFATHNQRNDREGPFFNGETVVLHDEVQPAVDAYASFGLIGATADAQHGGAQLPFLLAEACLAWFFAANVATTTYASLATGVANLIVAHGSPEQIEQYVGPLFSGEYLGTMCLSEPQAGSSLSDLTSRATLQPDGTYRLSGNKMWIGAADHELSKNIVHLVLARTDGAAAGTRGLSLFIVPKFIVDANGSPVRNDVAVAGLNDKMGQRGIVNAALNFGDGTYQPYGRPGAVAWIVGEPGAGLKQMFHMMNEARISVGLCAASIGSAGYLHALEYARVREQGRTADRAASSPQVPIIAHADVRRMLLTSKAYVEGGLALCLYGARLIDDKTSSPDPRVRESAALTLDVLTPVIKSWPAKWCTEANDLAIQIHGGYGYTKDYIVEQLYRDNRVNSIYEGTYGIQATDLVGRKLAQSSGVTAVVERIDATLAAADAAGGEAAELAAKLKPVVGRWKTLVARLASSDARSRVLPDATDLLDATGHIVVAWLWIDQILALPETQSEFAEGKRYAARFFVHREVPRIEHVFDNAEADLDGSVPPFCEIDERAF